MKAEKLANPWLDKLRPYYEKPLPADVIKLDLSENLYGPSPKVFDVVFANLDAIGQYTRLDHVIELKNALSKYTGLAVENISVFHGADAALDCVLRCFTKPGDKVVIHQPTYPVFISFAKAFGVEVIDVYLKKPNFTLSLDEAIPACREAKVVFICNPNNPTGNIVISANELSELLKLDIMVVIDEAYYEFSKYTVAHMVRDYSNLIVIRSFSKAFGLAGLRVGYALAAEEAINILEKARIPYEISILESKAAIAALSDLEYLEQVVSSCIEGRDFVYRSLLELSDVKPYESRANFLMFSLKRGDIKAPKLAEHLLNKYRVAVKDLSRFKGLGEEYLRVGIGKMEHNKIFVDSLKAALAELR
ncbi:MAG: histidinol-phosphate transaminase [Candidatus Methanomethylicota archaeon]|uniref:Histidinol-phosphate transaminase n=1 Tax=Thermoproteota archaeon TaxID=2056631 RepID=A0A497EUD4_9CREN|nr:MAG: histidinol-phosphate transaminase [Candidatus Verstraetearchaeota archaeon]